jgi:hypothetical protein
MLTAVTYEGEDFLTYSLFKTGNMVETDYYENKFDREVSDIDFVAKDSLLEYQGMYNLLTHILKHFVVSYRERKTDEH